MLNVGLHCVSLTWFADNIFVYRDPDPTSLFVLHWPVSEHFWTSTCTKCFFIFFLNDGSKKYIKNLLWARIACSNQIIFYPSIPVRYRTYYSNLNVKICKPCRFWASYVVWIRFTRPTYAYDANVSLCRCVQSCGGSIQEHFCHSGPGYSLH